MKKWWELSFVKHFWLAVMYESSRSHADKVFLESVCLNRFIIIWWADLFDIDTLPCCKSVAHDQSNGACERGYCANRWTANRVSEPKMCWTGNCHLSLC